MSVTKRGLWKFPMLVACLAGGWCLGRGPSHLVALDSFLENPPSRTVAHKLVVSPYGGLGSFQGVLDPPSDPIGAFVIDGGLHTGLRLTTVEHFPWFSPPASPICGEGADIFCPAIALPAPADATFNIRIYQDGEPVYQNDVPGFGDQYNGGNYIDISHSFESGHYYTVLAGYRTESCGEPPCINPAATLFWEIPDSLGQDAYYVQETKVEDWPEDWDTGGGYGGASPFLLTFYYESQPLVPVFDAASEWAEWPVSSGQWATNHGSTLWLEDDGYVNVTWTLTHPQNFVYSRTYSASGGAPYPIELPDLAQHPTLAGVDSGFELEIFLQNGFGVAETLTYPLSSFRPLRFNTISWNVHYEDLPNSAPDKHQYGLVTQRNGRSDENSCFIPDTMNNTQRIVFEIDQWGQSFQDLAAPAPDYRFRGGVLLSKQHNPNQTNNVIFPGGDASSNSSMVVHINTFLLNYRWKVFEVNEEYPAGDYIELALMSVTDDRSGNKRMGPMGDNPSYLGWTWPPQGDWQEHRLRLRQVTPTPCDIPATLTFRQGTIGGPASLYNFTPGTDLPIWFLPQFEPLYFQPGTPQQIDYFTLTFYRNGTALDVPSIVHPWSNCEAIYQNPALINENVETILLPGDLPLEGSGITLEMTAYNERIIYVDGDDCSDLPEVFSASIPIIVDESDPGPVTLQDLQLIIDGTEAKVDTATGAVNFEFCAEPSGQAQESTDLEWRWFRQLKSGTIQYWYDGQWTDNHGYHKVGPGSANPFSHHWVWYGDVGDCELSTASAPFTTTNQITTFFDNESHQSIFVEARLRYDASTVSDPIMVNGAPFTVVSDTGPDPTLGMDRLEASVSGGPWSDEETTYTEGEVGTLALRITTNDEEDNSGLFGGVFFNLIDLTGGTLIHCHPATNSFAVSWHDSGQFKYYSLTPLTGTLRNHLDQRGRYRLQILPAVGTCGAPVDRLNVDLNVNPPVTEPESRLLVRLDFRDHLGSSMVSKVFRTTVPDGGAQGTGTVTLNSTPVTLHGHEPEFSFYEPFGDRLAADGTGTADTRYTDHEFDGFSGLNYMKGRFQLASLAKFTRPDPMRDWEWINPHSINLYQYCGNDAINCLDPTGLRILPIGETSLQRIREIVPESLRNSIQLNDEGFVDWNRMINVNTDNENFIELREIAENKEKTVEILISNPDGSYTIKDDKDQITNDPGPHGLLFHLDEENAKGGRYGVTLSPTESVDGRRSPNANIQVVLLEGEGAGNAPMPESEKATTTAHELLGHALPHIKGDKNWARHDDENPRPSEVEIRTQKMQEEEQKRKEPN